jgi:hypothetical protein
MATTRLDNDLYGSGLPGSVQNVGIGEVGIDGSVLF